MSHTRLDTVLYLILAVVIIMHFGQLQRMWLYRLSFLNYVCRGIKDTRWCGIVCMVSTGGPATTVTWTRDSVTVTEGTETVLDDPVTTPTL